MMKIRKSSFSPKSTWNERAWMISHGGSTSDSQPDHPTLPDSCISKSENVYLCRLRFASRERFRNSSMRLSLSSSPFFLCLIAALANPAQLAHTQPKQTNPVGKIEGTITVTSSDQIFEEILRARSLNRYDEHVHLSKEPRPYTLSEKAVVYIEEMNNGMIFSPPSRNPQLDQQDLMFRPLVLPVLVGTTVDFPNSDDVFHNVFSYSKPKEFDLGRYPNGQRKRVLFD